MSDPTPSELMDGLHKLDDRMVFGFARADKRFESMQVEINVLRESMNRRFDNVDQRFDAIDQRFDAIDQRFDALESLVRSTIKRRKR